MRKTIFMAAAAVAMLGMTACSGNNSCKDKACGAGLDEDQVYTGVLPAADNEAGIRYTLKLDYDDDKNFKEGDYDLVETVLATDSVGTVSDKESYKSEGDFTVVEQNGKKYLKLVKDAKDSHANASANLYFEVASDSTLTMVNAELQPAVSDSLNYTLKLVK
ncbi:MAG: copper resistance protein NlpE N-terminal domain-containing protein [Muribaculaceae bacterium]|nr:copper resistance protein NlpE N-terminal domain-containing protein [Muribaculaceae bacterium]